MFGANMLSPVIISKTYTSAQIDTKISELTSAYEDAFNNLKYSLDDVQSKQSVMRQRLKDISDELNTWLEAKYILSGESVTAFYSGNYTGPN
jgi:hypothetical protein